MRNRLLLFKEIPDSYKRPEVEYKDEVEMARHSIYFWFYIFLNLSKSYKEDWVKNREPLKYGDVSLKFEVWWKAYGRNLFAEKMDKPPSVQLMNMKRRTLDANYYVTPKEDFEEISERSFLRKASRQEDKNKVNVDPIWLAIEVPIFIRRSQVTKQIKAILDEYHPNKKIKVRKFSTAKLKLQDNRMRWLTFEKTYRTYEAVQTFPNKELWKIGEELNLSPVFNTNNKETDGEKKYKHRLMTLVVQRYLRDANALIKNAEKGIFPKKTLK
jgi:hypothetical protein